MSASTLSAGAAHKLRDRFAGALGAIEDGIHLSRDRQFNFVFTRQDEERLCGGHAFGNPVHSGEDFAERPASGEFHADMPVSAQRAVAGQNQVAHSGEAAQGLGACAQRGSGFSRKR